jgi:hypothetical protein
MPNAKCISGINLIVVFICVMCCRMEYFFQKDTIAIA